MGNRDKRVRLLILGFLSILSLGFYLVVSNTQYRIGFPLDDAWIHQTYARNVAAGEWAFLPGTISGGSTSPLWTLILSLGYLLRIPYLGWTFGINLVVLFAIALIAENQIRKSVSSYQSIFPWIGTIFILEWHFVWAAGSGMETLLFTAVVLAIFVSLMRNNSNFLLIGFLIGLGIWLRPEGITLLAPALLVWLLRSKPKKDKIQELLLILIPFIILFATYLIFFYQLIGSPWPTTFYAKQAEYQSITANPFWLRLGYLGVQLLVGVSIILLPGYFINILSSSKNKKWVSLSSFVWVAIMIALYAWKLPVTYQHGRYMIPGMVILVLFGLIGMTEYLTESNRRSNIIGYSWKISLIIILVYFWISGALSYGRDVEFIETQMVDTTFWLNDNIPSERTVAVHDIGAIGYFGNNSILDLAGLINPEVISILDDQDQLAKFLDDSGVDYLVLFPGWYPDLTIGLEVMYSGFVNNLDYNEAMVVYKWGD